MHDIIISEWKIRELAINKKMKFFSLDSGAVYADFSYRDFFPNFLVQKNFYIRLDFGRKQLGRDNEREQQKKQHP